MKHICMRVLLVASFAVFFVGAGFGPSQKGDESAVKQPAVSAEAFAGEEFSFDDEFKSDEPAKEVLPGEKGLVGPEVKAVEASAIQAPNAESVDVVEDSAKKVEPSQDMLEGGADSVESIQTEEDDVVATEPKEGERAAEDSLSHVASVQVVAQQTEPMAEGVVAPVAQDAVETPVWDTHSDDSLVDQDPALVEPVLSYHQLDSVEDGPGNWFFKAQIMKRARVEINEIRKIMERVQALREPNQKLADALDARFDAFYTECGFQKGEIAVSLKYIEEQLALLKPEGHSGAFAREAPAVSVTMKDLEVKRDLLRMMQQNFDEIVEDDKVSRELFALFGNELGRVNQYLDVALEKYEDIENTLNDEAAEFNLHAIEAAKTNIENIERYLTGDFAGFYSKLSARVDELMAQVRSDLQKLRDMGVELNRKIREERARQEAERLEAEKRRKQEELQRIEDAKLWNRVKRWGRSAWDWMINKISAVGKMFTGDSKPKAATA